LLDLVFSVKWPGEIAEGNGRMQAIIDEGANAAQREALRKILHGESTTSHWKPGGRGAFRMGIEHGVFCLGCCWILMGLLFFGGVMSLWWIGGLTLFVLLEKVMPFGAIGGRVIGGIVAVWGLMVLIHEFLET